MPLLPPVVGSYEPLLQLASGGMATVYAVRQVGAKGFERVVVMKRVHPHLRGDREFCKMFLEEARLSSLIKHPNIVPVIDVVEDADELFLIMDYVESVSLAHLMKSLAGERLPPAIAARILCDVLGGLHAAHEAVDLRGNAMGIIHRDVSPQNVIVGVDGTSRLIDFGVARASSRLTPATQGSLKGKCGYMAPEQIRQQTLDRRADVFAAGVVLHEALTSARLFPATDDADALLAVLINPVPDPSSIVPGLSPALDAVVQRAVAQQRDDRFPTAAELAAALEAGCPPASPREVASLLERASGEVLGERRRKLREAFGRPPRSTSGSAPPPSASPGSPDLPIAWNEGPSREPTRRRVTFALGGAAVVLVGGVLAAVVPARTRDATPASVVPPPSAEGAPSASAPPSPSAMSPGTQPDAGTEGAPSSSSPGVGAPRAAPPRPVVTPVTPRPTSRPAARDGDLHTKNPYLHP